MLQAGMHGTRTVSENQPTIAVRDECMVNFNESNRKERAVLSPFVQRQAKTLTMYLSVGHSAKGGLTPVAIQPAW